MSGTAWILLIGSGGAAAVLPSDDHLHGVTQVDPSGAAAALQDLQSRRVPVVVVIDAATVNLPTALTELAIKHPEVPVIVAADQERPLGSTASRAIWRRRGTAALVAAVRDATRTAVQQARVRTTLNRFNIRLQSAQPLEDERQHHRLLLARLYLSNILEQARDAIFVTDREGVVALWNQAAERLFGARGAGIVGRRIDALGESSYGPGLLASVESVSPAAPARVVEITAQTPDGPRELEVSLSLVTDHGGAGIAVSGIARDMTERNTLYRELQQKTEALAASNRHKEEFLAVLSHELRTPLNTVLGWARMLQQLPHDPEHVSRAADMILRNATVQWRLVSDLLEYARMTAGQMTLHRSLSDLAALARVAVDGVRPQMLQKGLTVVDSLEGPAAVSVDRERIAQVLTNLLTNAMKFTPPGGEVHVAVRRAGATAELEVRDTGRGIDPAFLPHIFDAFRQADASPTRTDQGLGLGLAITRRIVELHGGQVDAHSEGRECGATFTVRLPLANE